MTFKVLNFWRADLPQGTVFEATEYGLSQLDIEFLLRSGRIETAYLVIEPAKLKTKKRKD